MDKINKLEDMDKAMQLAAQIEMIKGVLFLMDEEHLRQSIAVFKNQASFQDSAAVLNPRYDPVKSRLLRIQANTLQSLLELWDGLKVCQKLKDEIEITNKNRESIESFFI